MVRDPFPGDVASTLTRGHRRSHSLTVHRDSCFDEPRGLPQAIERAKRRSSRQSFKNPRRFVGGSLPARRGASRFDAAPSRPISRNRGAGSVFCARRKPRRPLSINFALQDGKVGLRTAGLASPSWRAVRARLAELDLRKHALRRDDKLKIAATKATAGEYRATRPFSMSRSITRGWMSPSSMRKRANRFVGLGSPWPWIFSCAL